MIEIAIDEYKEKFGIAIRRDHDNGTFKFVLSSHDGLLEAIKQKFREMHITPIEQIYIPNMQELMGWLDMNGYNWDVNMNKELLNKARECMTHSMEVI